jgi:nitrilase
LKVSVVQEPPVYLDLDKSLERGIDLIAESAGRGAQLVVFPETWLAGYPTFVWRLPPGAGMSKTDALFALSQRNSVDLSKDGLAPIRAAAKENGAVVVLGYQEVDGQISGSTIFNSCAIIDADGRIANNHRKLMPTNPERMIWGFGDGSGLNVVDTAVGRVGALICWETTCRWHDTRCTRRTLTSMSRRPGTAGRPGSRRCSMSRGKVGAG